MSRTAVRGFRASMSRSRYRLKAMAALRAKTMHPIINKKSISVKPAPVVSCPKKKPIKAKGRANMLCAKSTNEKYFFIAFSEILLRVYAEISIDFCDGIENVFAACMGLRRCKKHLRNFFKPFQKSFFELRYVLSRFEIRLLVGLCENQKKRDSTFTKPFAEVKINLLWFVPTVD